MPSPTRWNSYHDVVTRVVENPSEILNELCTSIGLRTFTEKELAFLKEYCAVLRPLSRGLDILQGEDHCYYGTLLPTLTTILKKTKAEVPNLSSMTTGLAYAIESSIKRQFSYIFDAKDAIVAALTLPKFKVKWVDSQEKKDSYKQMLMEELHTLESDISIEENGWSDKSATQQDKKTDFYEFDIDDDEPEEDDLESEVAKYFKNAKSLECLEKYPKN